MAALPGRAEDPGLVEGVLGMAVAPGPGQPPSQTLRGGLALRLEQVQVDGTVWSHLLASDGRHGWSAQDPGPVRPVATRPVVSGFELMPLPPEDPGFQSSTGRPVPENSAGRLLGGSRGSQVADTRDLLVPAWLSPSLAPWPRWAMAGVEGYAPLADVALDWPTDPQPVPALAAATRVLDLLGGRGLLGLSRQPFLAPLAAQLQAMAPADGTPALDLSSAPGKPPRPTVLRGNWQGPLAAYRASADKAGRRSALLVFGQAKARAFALIDHAGAARLLVADEDELFVARLDEADLDADGLPEWLMEVVGVYGDGYYSELWLIPGRSGPAAPAVRRLALSRSSGEAPAQAQDAAWWVGADRQLWVWRSTPKGSRLTASRYARGSLAEVPAGRNAALVSLGMDESLATAQQRQWASAALGAKLLPHQTRAGLRWLTAVPQRNRAQAARWAAQQGLPASAVLALPWKP